MKIQLIISGLIAFLLAVMLEALGVSPSQIFLTVILGLKDSPLYLTSGPFAFSQHMAIDFGIIMLPIFFVLEIFEALSTIVGGLSD